MAPCVGLRVQSYCFLSNPPNFFAIIFQKFQQLAKIRRARCCRYYRSVPLARIRMEISQPRHPAWRHAPRMAQPNIPGEVVARLRTTSGVRFCWGISFPACRHAPAWRNTGLRTAAIPCRGLRLPRLSTALPRSLRRSNALPLTCTAPLRCLEARAAARGCKKGVPGGTP